MATTTNLGLSKIDASDYISPDPINAAFDILDKLGVDYVVEQGKSGEWWYRKWHSGRAECGIDNKNFGDIDHKSNWGGMFASNQRSFGNYPFAFASRPFTVISFQSTSNGSHSSYVAQANTQSTTEAPKFSLIDPNSGTALGATFGIYVCGRYK